MAATSNRTKQLGPRTVTANVEIMISSSILFQHSGMMEVVSKVLEDNYHNLEGYERDTVSETLQAMQEAREQVMELAQKLQRLEGYEN